jgi:hypothetical protein
MHRELGPDRKLEKNGHGHEHFLFEGIDYPVTKEDLVEIATDAAIDPQTLNLVRGLPEGTYRSRDEIWRSIGEATRVLAGNRNVGAPRDDLGKQAVREDGLHP